ncbi:glycoside hydrolase family 15 protein [Planosporangium mesophilum]|uniref:Glucan 1,4-alpha-glucosidase n=1 Tax=Planosporangium mesophilum TaxID=689768 RepID=A0A8J3TC09_9ACTN|nr:glycoside hydrolase family 15 protein [Planosporangium mesophilum]NJC84261.1 glucoamylase [Planosporangium mesophilum]GII23102.1 glucan 1,4-alpha-glucosidase [Planosporangium mesophilum]
MRRTRSVAVATAAVLALVLSPGASARAETADGPAPGAPGAPATWTPANKAGFGTAYGAAASKTWFTLSAAGGLSEVYYPDLSTPSARRLEFVVVEPGGRAVKVADAADHATTVDDAHGLTYRQTDTDRAGRWRLDTTYVTDPARSTVAVRVDFTSTDRRARQLYVLYDPALSNNGSDDTGATSGRALLASDATTASALVAAPDFTAISSGYLGTSDGWTDLAADGRLDHAYDRAATPGNVVQTGRTALTGLPGARHLELALGFGSDTGAALRAGTATLRGGFERAAAGYGQGWQRYLRSLNATPASLRTTRERQLYRVSAMVLAASEDKANPGAYIASPSMPWVWGDSVVSDVYHAVWSRDLYEVATGLIAVGDRAGANRALDFLFTVQQKPDGSFPQNSTVDGRPVWGNLQLDEVAYPIVLAEQLGRTDAATWTHVKAAADFLVAFSRDGNSAPWTPQERWENQSGYSPATIASEIAGLVCAARIAHANGDTAAEQRYLQTADAWQRRVESWTVTSTGPYSSKPYYLRLTKDGNPNAGTTYSIGDGGPSAVDQRAVVDPSFLELVRLGVKPARDTTVVNSLAVVDEQLSFDTPRGRFWHRFSFDGYGETLTGEPWNYNFPADSRATRGRGWPIFNGERGEYAIAAGDLAGARSHLATIARTANSGAMLPEQVWDDNPPSGAPGFTPGAPTFSATPLIWTHAQYVRLAQDVSAGRVSEQPRTVACRYVGRCD